VRYYALATDYDGTLAREGRVEDEAARALERVRDSGRKLILVTGRELPDLVAAFPRLDLFDRVVAENGALLYRPASREEKRLAEPPPADFVELLRARGVRPLSAGRVIVSTTRPREGVVLEAIRALNLELQVVFNKGAVMALPSGVNKATGLRAALDELDLSAHNVVGVGDAENDQAFLAECECAVAVSDALPGLRDRVDVVLDGGAGDGVIELAARLLADDLASLAPRRHELLLGIAADGTEVRVRPYGQSFLLAGTSGSGKTTFATSFLERLEERKYQYCVIDPEGDYTGFEPAVALGDAKNSATVGEVLRVLGKPGRDVSVNLLGIGLAERPAFFQRLLAALLDLRARTGRPHWILIDETHHLLPAGREAGAMPSAPHGLAMITVHPEHVAKDALARADLLVVIGKTPAQTMETFGGALGEPVPAVPPGELPKGEAIAWSRIPPGPPIRFRAARPRAELKRHVRKYADGELGPDRSFYFRGPEGKLNLRAQNLKVFLQLAEGVDDATWLHHLRAGDYSFWIREAIKDPRLAEEVGRIEGKPDVPVSGSRSAIRTVIEERYTEPA
jgi:hydroxymethylpyrimidine pyrophosphatase-like HAD family hydrolase